MSQQAPVVNITAPTQNFKGKLRPVVSMETVRRIVNMVGSARQPVFASEIWYRLCFELDRDVPMRTVPLVLRHLVKTGVLVERVETQSERSLRHGSRAQTGTQAKLYWLAANGSVPARTSLTVLPDTDVTNAALAWRNVTRDAKNSRPAKRTARVQTGRASAKSRPARAEADVQTGANRIERLERRIASLEATISGLAKLLR